jgi:TonB family protein
MCALPKSVDYEPELEPRPRVPSHNVVRMPPTPPLFTGLPPAPQRRKYFLASFIVQTIVFAILIKTGVLNPPAAVKQALGTYVTLVAPAPTTYAPKPVVPPPPVVMRARVQPPLTPPSAIPQPPVTRAPKLPQEKVAETPRVIETPKAATNLPPSPKPEKKVAAAGFSSGSSVIPDSKLAASKVQTGGFGDPSGVVPSPTGSDKSKLAQVGSFDLPSGAGKGNGTGGSHGAVAVVASAGFGNGVATMNPGKDSGGVVRDTGFGNMASSGAPAPAHHSSPPAGKLTPAEITSKPNPVYTDEARHLKIEGEVLLKVNFTVSGNVEVLGVVRGLGHGLDEAAVRAAQGMRFKPAMRDGRPVDSTATVHVLFQLT